MSTQKSATNKDPPVQRLDRSVSLAGPHQHNVQPLSLSTDLPRLRTYTAQSGTHPSELLEAYREQINSVIDLFALNIILSSVYFV